MTTEPDLSYHPAMNEICLGVMDAVTNQPGDTAARSARRGQMAADTISSMLPHNPLETMLAGQCVMFDQLVRDATRDLLRGQPEEVKLRVRPQICAAGRMVLAFLAKFEQSQARTESKLGVQRNSVRAAPEPARPAAKAPNPVQKPDPRPAPEPVTASVQTRDPAPAGNDAAAPAPAEPNPELPSAARQPLPAIPTGQATTAEIDDALIAACRELAPRDRVPDRARDRDAAPATPPPDDTRLVKKVEELV